MPPVEPNVIDLNRDTSILATLSSRFRKVITPPLISLIKDREDDRKLHYFFDLLFFIYLNL